MPNFLKVLEGARDIAGSHTVNGTFAGATLIAATQIPETDYLYALLFGFIAVVGIGFSLYTEIRK